MRPLLTVLWACLPMLLRVAFILFVHDQLPVAASTTTGMISHTNPGTMSSASQPLPVARARAAYLLIALLLMQDVVLLGGIGDVE